MLKNLLIVSLITLRTTHCFSQDTNEFRVFYGVADADFLNDNSDGSGSLDIEEFSEFGFRYIRNLSENFALETGLSYTNATVVSSSVFTGDPVTSREADFKMISIPLYANYTLWDYLFINGGPLLDIQTSETSSIDTQNGIGFSIGIGGKYYFDDFSVFVNPNFRTHALIPFDKENDHQNLSELGVQIGFGHRF